MDTEFTSRCTLTSFFVINTIHLKSIPSRRYATKRTVSIAQDSLAARLAKASRKLAAQRARLRPRALCQEGALRRQRPRYLFTFLKSFSPVVFLIFLYLAIEHCNFDLEQPFARLILHAVAEYYDLVSHSSEHGNKKKTRVTHRSNRRAPLPKTSLVEYLGSQEIFSDDDY